MNGEFDQYEEQPKFEWSCPRLGCKKYIVSYTERGMRLLSEEHILQHMREDRESPTLGQITQKINEEVKAKSDALAIVEEKDYNILKLTAVDIGFLKTRLIKIDDQIEYDPAQDPRPTNDELNQWLWRRILDKVWDNGKPD